jgi:hypothetical protein
MPKPLTTKTSTDYTTPGVRRLPPVTFNPLQPVKTKTSR